MDPFSEKPRILMITARADIGGGPRHMFDLAEALSENVTLFLCSPAEPPYEGKFRGLAEDFFEIPKRSFSLWKAIGLYAFCRRHKIGIVHSHGRGAGTYSRFLGVLGLKVVHTFHGFHVQRGLKARLILWIEKALALVTDRFIAVSNGERERVLAQGVASTAKTSLIFNGIVDHEPFPVRGGDSRIVFGGLTRFDPQKGNDILLRAIAGLPAKSAAKVTFRLAGEGPELAALRLQIQQLGIDSLVELPGPTADPESFLKDIDVYVSASRGEGLSYATLESLRAGRPLLLSRVTDHIELDGLPGVSFFSLDKLEEFAQAVADLIAQRPITRLPAQFTLKNMASETLVLYRGLL